MSSKRARTIAFAACAFAGLAGGEAFTYATVHQTIHLVVAAVAALVFVLIVGTTAIITRRAGNSDNTK
ncbi:hypothetical protein A5647_24185 [Mycobacterium sp. 1100029.7]|nr:hypothetical protein A5647_24185 [Mycobacterium sp. 1100029.7]